MTLNQRTITLGILQKAYEFRRDSDVGYLLLDSDIINGIYEDLKREVQHTEIENFFNEKYPQIKNKAA